MLQDEITFRHSNVQSLHTKTVEITRDEHLTPRGDCIIGVRASKACADLGEPLKRRLRANDSIVKMEIMVCGETFTMAGSGDERLSMLNAHDIVVRKTNFACPRTVSVRCDKASSDVPRKMVKLLQDSNAKGIFRITVE